MGCSSLGIEDIKQKILADARERTKQIREEAEKKAKPIVDEAKDKARQIKKDSKEKAELEAEAKKKRVLALARLEARKSILAARHDLTEEAFVEAVKRLSEINDGEYRAIMKEMLLSVDMPDGNVEVILYPRKDCFAPLKSKEGKDTPEAVRQTIQDFDRRTFEQISGTPPPDRPFELDPAFYYPTAELIEKWNGQPLPDADYIEP